MAMILHFPKQRWPLTRKATRRLRHGWLAGAGREPWWLVFWLAQQMARQGWSVADIRGALLDPDNVGGEWVRSQRDPDLVLERLFEALDWNQLPYLPMKERHRRVVLLLRSSGSMSQKALVAAVGHVNSGHVRRDLQDLARAGVVRITSEPHGKVNWHTIELLVDDDQAERLLLTMRVKLARAIAAREARGQTKVHTAFGYRGEVCSPPEDSDAADPSAAAEAPDRPARRATLAEVIAVDPFGVSRIVRPKGWLRDLIHQAAGTESEDVDPRDAAPPEPGLGVPDQRPQSREQQRAAWESFCCWCEENL